MAKQEDLGKGSPKLLKEFVKAVKTEETLIYKREKSLDNVLLAEQQIATTREGALNRYFQAYSEKLTALKEQNDKLLNDTFSVLNHNLTARYNELSSQLATLEQQLAESKQSQPTRRSPEREKPKQEKRTETPSSLPRDTTKASQPSAQQKTPAGILDYSAEKKAIDERAEIQRQGNATLLNIERQNQTQRQSQLKRYLEQLPGLESANTFAQSNPVVPEETLSADINSEERLTQLQQQYTDVSNGTVTAVTEAINHAELTILTAANKFITALEKLTKTNEELNLSFKTAGGNDGKNKGGDNGGDGNNKGGPTTPDNADNRPRHVRSYIDSDTKQNLQDSTTTIEALFEDLTKRRTEEAEITQIARIKKEDRTDEQNEKLNAFYKDARKERNQEVDFAAKQIKTESNRLALAKSEAEEDKQSRASEFMLTQLGETLTKERRAAEQSNQVKMNLGEAPKEGSKEELELAGLRARSIEADAELQAAKEMEDEIAAYRNDLNYQSARKGKELNAETLAENEKQLQKEFETRKGLEERIAEIKKRNTVKEADPKLYEANEKKKAEYIEKLESHKLAKKGKLSEKDRQEIKKQADEKYSYEDKNLKKLEKERKKEAQEQQRERKKDSHKQVEATTQGPLTKDNNLVDRFKTLGQNTKDKTDNQNAGEMIVAALDTAVVALSSLIAKLEKTVDEVASYQGFIDTRLQGSNNTQSSGSYWSQLTKDMMSVGAVTPFFKQSAFAENIKTLVNQGIAFDLKQRAFLMTIQEKIANTFNVADGTLLRLIRIQQEDSTAGRLGMESALNAFLNEMYETSEYLNGIAQNVRGSLEEMEALMSGAAAAEVEYQVQKWMGSLYSVGMSQEAVQNIANALGQLAAGQIDALTGGTGAGNLLVMAANKSGKPISEILAEGLDASETNDLLQATVNYLAELADSSKDSRVVQQQLASVFGVKASDLKAAVNLATGDGTTEAVSNSNLTYDAMLKRLNDMANTMYKRTSLGEMMTNIWENGQYSLSSGIANNPIAYLLYKMSSLLEATTGGIPLPDILLYGFGVELSTTIADLMRVASMSTGIIGSLGDMISGLSSSFSGQAMLEKMEIGQGSGLKVTPRGKGDGLSAYSNVGGGAQEQSSSGYTGNSSSSDIKNSTIQDAEDSKEQTMIEAKEEAEATAIDYINTNVLKIYELLDEVTSGKRNFNVKVAGYGLTSLSGLNGAEASISGAQGGVGGLLSNNTANNTGSNTLNGGFTSGSGTSGNGTTGSTGTGSSTSFGANTGIDLGGWIMA